LRSAARPSDLDAIRRARRTDAETQAEIIM
jgi:hypothetical protein